MKPSAWWKASGLALGVVAGLVAAFGPAWWAGLS